MLSSYLLLAITLLVGIFQIEKLFPEKFKAKPWIIFGLLIVLTVVSFINEYQKNKAEQTAKKIAKIESDRRDYITDSTAEARVKISTKNILDGFGKAIGKYSLGYDSAKQEIVALQKLIKDSANRKTTIIQGNNPIINFTSNKGMVLDSISNDFIKIHISLTSYSAPSILKYATVASLYSTDNLLQNLTYVSTIPFFTTNLGIPENTAYKQDVGYVGNPKKVKKIYVLVKGTYTDSYGKNPQELDILGQLTIPSNTFSIVVQPYADSIRVFTETKIKNHS